MTRIRLGLFFFVVSCVVLYSEGRMPALGLPAFFFAAAECAVIMPVSIAGVIMERLFHIELSRPVIVGLAALYWYFPVDRVRRWAGTFDAFTDSNRRPAFSRGAAAVLDTLNRLKVGKGKMGGWA